MSMDEHDDLAHEEDGWLTTPRPHVQRMTAPTPATPRCKLCGLLDREHPVISHGVVVCRTASLTLPVTGEGVTCAECGHDAHTEPCGRCRCEGDALSEGEAMTDTDTLFAAASDLEHAASGGGFLGETFMGHAEELRRIAVSLRASGTDERLREATREVLAAQALEARYRRDGRTDLHARAEDRLLAAYKTLRASLPSERE